MQTSRFPESAGGATRHPLPAGSLAFPLVTPNEDELLYSVIARTKVRLGLIRHKPMLRAAFGRTTRIASPDLQSGAAQLAWLCNAMTGVTPAQLLRRHTLFPLWEAVLPPERSARAERALLLGTLGGAYAQLGAIATRVKRPGHLRLCPQCAALEREKDGEIYWHRLHQAPGVYTCPSHGCVLVETDVPMRSRGRHDFVHARWEHLANGRPATVPDGPVASASRIVASQLARLLRGDLPDLRAEVIARLSLPCPGSRKSAAAALAQLLVTRFGSAYLEQIGLADGIGSQSGWIAGAMYRPKRLSHPLRFILLSLAFGHESPHLPVIKATRWPCVNPAAAHYGRPTVTILESGPRLSDGGQRYSCSCGFVFSSDGTLAGGRLVIRRVISWGWAIAEEAARMRAKGMSIRAIAHALEMDSKSVRRLWSAGRHLEPERDMPPDVGARRSAWRASIEAAGGAVAVARQSAPAVYAWLYRNDRAWLLHTNAPHRKPTRGLRRRVDWVRRDAELSARISELAAVLLGTLPPLRITMTGLTATLGCGGSIRAWIPRLPSTRATLGRVCENVEQFQRRRLLHVAREFRESGRRPSRSQLLRATGLTTRRLTPALAQAVAECLRGD